MPSTKSDTRNLYGQKNISEILTVIEREASSLEPNRIIVLFVPSQDANTLVSALDFVCFLAPLNPSVVDQSNHNYQAWRHEPRLVKDIVYQTLQASSKATDALKIEITDKRISPFTLPALNFYYPDKNSTIDSIYKSFNLAGFEIDQLTSALLPNRFTRDQLTQKAFKGSAHATTFFQDMRKRVFPPDLHHAHARESHYKDSISRLSLALRQRYRFGVTVRDGNLHYDVQYESGRTLNNEAMHCATYGDVLVTGSHANVGVNDFVWVPNGTKIPTKQ